ncbi:outer membrane family protein, partial [Helicobacter pylori]|uniref:outer membrane family protein n=1 Tax=Helicobacter pylori TaxID=210 RepID=UPI0009B29CD9
MLNQKVWLGLLALNGVFLNAFEYQISARVGLFSRIAFNQSVNNSKKGIYPTGSYVPTTG